MKDKVNFKTFGVLTWTEAWDNPEVSVEELMHFGETPAEEEAIFKAGMTGCEGFVDICDIDEDATDKLSYAGMEIWEV